MLGGESRNVFLDGLRRRLAPPLARGAQSGAVDAVGLPCRTMAGALRAVTRNILDALMTRHARNAARCGGLRRHLGGPHVAQRARRLLRQAGVPSRLASLPRQSAYRGGKSGGSPSSIDEPGDHSVRLWQCVNSELATNGRRCRACPQATLEFATCPHDKDGALVLGTDMKIYRV